MRSAPNRRVLIDTVDVDKPRHRPAGQAPAPTPSAGSSGHSGRSHGGHGGHYYYPYYYYGSHYRHHYYPYFYPFGYGYYGHHYPYGYGRGSYGGGGLGALDLNVKPKKAEVFVDGNPIGSAGRYDGYPGYLWLEPGTYSLTFYLEGYQTLTRDYTVDPEVVTAIHELLPPGEATPPPEPAPLPPPPETYAPRGSETYEPRDDGGRRGGAATVGRIKLSIRPADTAIYLDGHFLGTAGELAQLSAGLMVEPGRHTLELVRPGYETEEVPISVPDGESIEVDLELRRR